MTRYTVLRQVDGDGPLPGWVEVSVIDARDDKHAIQQATDEPGTYVAVPTRSWKPRTRAVETVVKDVWS